MATTDRRYAINGVVSTDKTVLQNLDTLTQACQTWLTYDINQGRWSFVINQAGNSVASFGDHNIIGAITVSGTALTSMYNSVQVQFPHVDLNNSTDTISIEIPQVDRNPNEPDQQLNISTDVVIDPVQAQLIGYMELQQSRIDTVISFVTDFTSLGLRAGDIIDVTSSIYGLTNVKFRIITIRESDTDSGEIQLAITAQLYSDAVYDTTGLTRLIRTGDTGIVGIGNIGRPGAPTVTVSSTSSIPHVAIASSAPSGVVTGMEFHYSTDTETVYDENRTYNLAGTVTAANGTFAFGETVRFNFANPESGNLVVKTRGVNSATVGAFSRPTSNFAFVPKTAAGAITNQTKILDNTGSLVTSLGASYLLSQLAGLIKGNTASGGLLSTILGAVTTKSGAQAGAGGYVFETDKTYTSSSGFVASGTSDFKQQNVCVFTPKVTGHYHIRGITACGGVATSSTPNPNGAAIFVFPSAYYSGSLDSGTNRVATAALIGAGATGGAFQETTVIGGAFQISNEQFVDLTAGTSYYICAFFAMDSQVQYVALQLYLINTGLSNTYNPNNNIGKSGSPGYTSPVATELRYTVGAEQYINSPVTTEFEQPVGVEAYLNRNFGSGRITFGTDVYDGAVFGGIFQTTIDTQGYTAGTYTPYFEYWDQDVDPDVFSANVSTSLLDITIGDYNPQDEEFTPAEEEYTVAPDPDVYFPDPDE
jgi:hypothetical protein